MEAAKTDNLAQLGHLIRQRRHALGLTIAEAAVAAGFSTLTWGDLEHGKRTPRELTLAAVDKVLGWEIGSSRDVLRGGSPGIPSHARNVVVHGMGQSEAPSQEFEEAVARLRAAMNDPKATAEERQVIQALLDAAARTANMITDRRE